MTDPDDLTDPTDDPDPGADGVVTEPGTDDDDFAVGTADQADYVGGEPA